MHLSKILKEEQQSLCEIWGIPRRDGRRGCWVCKRGGKLLIWDPLGASHMGVSFKNSGDLCLTFSPQHLSQRSVPLLWYPAPSSAHCGVLGWVFTLWKSISFSFPMWICYFLVSLHCPLGLVPQETLAEAPAVPLSLPFSYSSPLSNTKWEAASPQAAPVYAPSLFYWLNFSWGTCWNAKAMVMTNTLLQWDDAFRMHHALQLP